MDSTPQDPPRSLPFPGVSPRAAGANFERGGSSVAEGHRVTTALGLLAETEAASHFSWLCANEDREALHQTMEVWYRRACDIVRRSPTRGGSETAAMDALRELFADDRVAHVSIAAPDAPAGDWDARGRALIATRPLTATRGRTSRNDGYPVP